MPEKDFLPLLTRFLFSEAIPFFPEQLPVLTDPQAYIQPVTLFHCTGLRQA